MDPSTRTLCGLLAVFALLGIVNSLQRNIIRGTEWKGVRMGADPSLLMLQVVAALCLVCYLAALVFGMSHEQITGWLAWTGTIRRG